MNLFTATLDGHARALDLLAQRQKVLAGNIANADTPGFKARDFDFAAALAEAKGGSSPRTPSATHAGHLNAAGALAGSTVSTVDLKWRAVFITSTLFW